jgi:outer membrane protein
MNESFRRPFVAGFSLWLASASAFAQTAQPPAAPAPAATPPAPANPPAPAPASAPAAPRRTLTVEQVVAQALRQNPTRSAAELSRDQARAGVTAEEGRYPYVLAGDAGYTRVTSPRLGANDSISSSTSRSITLGAALRRTFPIGTTAELRLQGERFDDNLDASSFAGNSSGGGYGLTARASLTQPLLRGAGTRVGELELRSARVQRDAADKQLRRVASETVRDSLLRYWELWYAEAQIEIERGALELAREQEREASAKVQQGALALADSFSFQTRVAELEESLVSAENARTQRALELATAIGAVDSDAVTLSASSELPEPGPLGSAKAVEAALARDSVELAELESNWRAASVRAEAAGESSRPRLDVEGYVQSQGLGEKISSAAERAAGMSYLAVHVGLSGELPLDGTRYRAERESALLAVRIAEQNLRGARVRLAAEAHAALENESSALRRLELAQRTLQIAQKSYEAESARFELGQTIPIQVRQAEDELRRAKLRVTRARVDVIEEQVLIGHLSGKLAEQHSLGD